MYYDESACGSRREQEENRIVKAPLQRGLTTNLKEPTLITLSTRLSKTPLSCNRETFAPKARVSGRSV